MSDTSGPVDLVAPLAAPAKLNLTLAVLGGRRADGFHELRGVFARLTLADELSLVGMGPPDGADTLAVRPRPKGDAHGTDLVVRATDLLRRWAARPLPRLDLALRKRIPVAAGLGGGSSDGAAALRLAARAWSLHVPEAELVRLASGLGADVPFFLAEAPIALVGGRGERIVPLPASIAGSGVLLVSRPGKPSTGEVFAAHDVLHEARGRREGTARQATERLVERLRSGGRAVSLTAMADVLRDANDLYPAAAAVMPWLERWRATVETSVGRPVLLTGAGPTLAVLYASAAEATRARRALLDSLRATREGSGPVRVIATAIAGKLEGSP